MGKQILKATLIAGVLDITAAFIQAYLTKKLMPVVILNYIASGLFGKQAFSGGWEYAAVGLLVHFFIVFCIALVYFQFYPRLGFLRRSVVLSAALIAILAWLITTRLIIPLSRIKPGPFNLTNALIAVGILFICVGLPIAWLARRNAHL